MNVPIRFVAMFLLAALSGCSKSPPPTQTLTSAAAPLPAASDQVLRAQIDAAGIATDYAALFESDRLVKIVEHRRAGASILAGEYEFSDARLTRYRGAKPRDEAAIDLQFDLQGTLAARDGADVSDDEIRELRNRAQLLRSHALARRATKLHH